jgi:hypothetical protein
MTLRAPPREPDPPREQWPMGITIGAVVAIIFIFGLALVAVPNPGAI